MLVVVMAEHQHTEHLMLLADLDLQDCLNSKYKTEEQL